jgi:hypothetical protein
MRRCDATGCAAMQQGVLRCNRVCCDSTGCAAMQQGVLRCNRFCCGATGYAAVQQVLLRCSLSFAHAAVTGFYACWYVCLFARSLFCATVRSAISRAQSAWVAPQPHHMLLMAAAAGAAQPSHNTWQWQTTASSEGSVGLRRHLAIGVEVRVEPDGPVASRHVLHRWRRLGVVRWQQDVEQETAVLVPAQPVPTWAPSHLAPFPLSRSTRPLPAQSQAVPLALYRSPFPLSPVPT